MKARVYENRILEYDYMLVNNFNRVMFFKYNTYARIKTELQNKIFLNKDIKSTSIDYINKELKKYNLICYLTETIGNIEYFKIVTIDYYEHNIKKINKVKLRYDYSRKKIIDNCSINLSDLD